MTGLWLQDLLYKNPRRYWKIMEELEKRRMIKKTRIKYGSSNGHGWYSIYWADGSGVTSIHADQLIKTFWPND